MIKQLFVKFAFNLINHSITNECEYEAGPTFIYIFGLLGALLPFSYAIIPNEKTLLGNEFFVFLAKLVRPHLFLNTIETIQSLLEYICYFGILFICLNISLLGLTQQYFAHSYNKFKVINQAMYYLNQIFDVWLFNIIIETLLLKSQIYNYIVAIIYCCILCYRIVLTKVSILFHQHTFNHQIKSFYYYCTQFWNVIQVLLFASNLNSKFFDLFQIIVSILVCSLNIANIIKYLPQTNLKLLKIQLPIYMNQLFSCIGVLMFQFYDFQNKDPQMLLIFLLPQCIKISEYIFQYKFVYTKDLENFENKIVHLFFCNQNDNNIKQEAIYKKNLSEKLFSLQEFSKKINNKNNSKVLQGINIKDKQQYFSLLLLYEDYFGAYEFISKQVKPQSIIQQIKYEICTLKCKVQLKQQMNQFSQSSSDNKHYNLDIESFVKIETQSKKISQQLIKDCQQKIKFISSLLNKNKIKKIELEKNAKLCIYQFEKNISEIESLYKQYPLKRYQRCLTFAYAELCNDFLQAIRVLNLTSFNDESIYTKILALPLDFYSTKTIYLITNLENMEIKKVSINYQMVMQKKISHLNEIIPKGVREHHDEMILNFLKTGESRFFQETTQTLYQNDNFIKPITVINDVFIQNNHINSITIATIPNDDEIVLIVDANLCIAGFTKGFLESIEINQDLCQYFLGIQIELLIPQFVNLSENNQVQYIELKLLSYHQLEQYLDCMKKNINYNKTLLTDLWNQKSKLDSFVSHCNISKSKYGFYIILFNYIKNQHKLPYRSVAQLSFAQITVHDKPDMDELVDIILPYESQNNQLDKQLSYTINKSEVICSGRDNQTIALIDIDQDNEFEIRRNKQKSTIRPQNKFQSYQDIVDDQEKQSCSFNQDNKKSYYQVKNMQKYGILEKFKQKTFSSKFGKLLIIFLLLNQMLFLSQIISSMINSLKILDQNNVDIDLLQIKYYLFQPVESFIVTRYTIINYNNQFSAKSITKSQLDKYLAFPNSNLNLGFDDVQQNQAEILNRLTLQDFLAQNYDFYIYIKTDVGELYNITMRQSLSILINYQYTFKAAYKYDGKTVSDSPYVFYSYRNLLTLYNAFDILNNDLYLQTNLKIQLDENNELTLLYPFIITQMILLALQIYCQFQNEQYLNRFFLLLLYCNSQEIEQEIKRLNKFLEIYHNKSEELQSFQFKIEIKEAEITEFKHHQNVSLLKSQQKQRSTEITIGNKYIILFFQTIILLSFGVMKYFVMKNYLNKYEPTCEFYLQMSYLGTNIPTIYAMREVLYYRWRYPYYNQDDLSQILNQVETCLQQVKNVTIYLQQLQMDKFVLSQDFNSYLEELSNNNLCDMISEDLQTRSKDFCYSTLGGSLQKGLQGTLIYIHSSIVNEQQINQFLNKTENTVNELEGVFIVSELIKQANQAFKIDFLAQAQLVKDSLIIISAIYLIFFFVSIVIIFVIINPYLQKQLYYSRRYLFLIPQVVLFIDDAFERQTKFLLNTQS